MPTRVWFLCVPVLLWTGIGIGAEVQPDGAEARLRAFFAEDDAARRARRAAEFGAVAPKAWDEVKAMLHRCAPRPDLGPGRHTFQTPGADGIPPIQYTLRVPQGYQGNAPKGWPLVVSTHGTGGSGEKAVSFFERQLGADAEKYLIAGPDSPQGGVYEAGRLTIEYPLHVLADVRRRANVDSDRTILGGYSRGGYTTWGTILFSPGEWAGAVPMASWPLTEAGSHAVTFYLQNVLNLAIQAHWGEKDTTPGQTKGINTLSREAAAEMKRLRARHFEGIEYAGQGHGLKLKKETIRTFLETVRRDPFPAECKFIFHRLYQGRAYYVRATAVAKEEFDFRKRRVLRIARKEDLAKAKRALWKRDGFELTVRMPPGKNLIAVFMRNVKSVDVALAADRLDFSRPIRITLGGRTVATAKRDLDWAELLETARQTYDFERLIGGRVSLPVRSR